MQNIITLIVLLTCVSNTKLINLTKQIRQTKQINLTNLTEQTKQTIYESTAITLGYYLYG